MLNCWLVLPYFSGAAYVYEHHVRPLFVNHQTVNIWYVPRQKGIFSRPDDFLLAAEKFIEENGPEAFQKLIKKVFCFSDAAFVQLETFFFISGINYSRSLVVSRNYAYIQSVQTK